ncbi:MAG: hypothetical protein DRZ90_16415 [Spirochaetes bacterium]|nr:MAG: hypothetical protein DRP60_07795 [Spirochaetota bacterium]RKX76744.1 MAG: hypothetical protein DRP49_02960 [Spirochaetota bacterium]RKX90324.1 MAG: hypothetical protein DRZ90_16415 [Spirochaetota bacterium]
MRRFSLILTVIVFSTLMSCSSIDVQPEADESVLVFYVEEFHKPINKPQIKLLVEGLENPLKLDLKAPAAVVHLTSAEHLHAIGWVTGNDITLNGVDNFDFTAPAGEITLAPIKIQVVNKSQVEVKLLTPLDLEYAKSRFTKYQDFAGLEINYPEIETETETDS